MLFLNRKDTVIIIDSPFHFSNLICTSSCTCPRNLKISYGPPLMEKNYLALCQKKLGTHDLAYML